MNNPMKLHTEADAKMAQLMGDLHRTYFTKLHPVLDRLLIPTLQEQLMQYILSAPEELLEKC